MIEHPPQADDWRALGSEAAQLLREGLYTEAAGAFDRVVALRPDHADSWFNLGYARRHARLYRDALKAYAQALALEVDSPEEAHLNCAAILSEHLHRTAEARAELERAVAANPKFTAAWLNLGNLNEDLGDSTKAREAYENALRISPGNGRALARLAAMTAHEGDPEEAVAFLEESGSSVRPGSEDSAEFCFALGNALDTIESYRRAFSVITEGNAIAASLRNRAWRYDRRAQETLVDSLIKAFPNAGAATATETHRSEPIFICGMFRSGSTLVEQLLSRHSAVIAGGELEFIPAMVAEELQPYPLSLIGSPVRRLESLRDQYLDQLSELFPGAALVTDKRPDNFLHIGLIKTLFPKARIVQTVRNSLDNILSAYFLYFGQSVAYSERLEDIVHYYTQYRRLMDHWAKLYPDDILGVDYDQLVADPSTIMGSLLEFLGLAWEDDCLDHRAGASTVRTASVWQVRKPLHRKSSGRWRNYEPELAGIRQQLLDLGFQT